MTATTELDARYGRSTSTRRRTRLIAIVAGAVGLLAVIALLGAFAVYSYFFRKPETKAFRPPK